MIIHSFIYNLCFFIRYVPQDGRLWRCLCCALTGVESWGGGLPQRCAPERALALGYDCHALRAMAAYTAYAKRPSCGTERFHIKSSAIRDCALVIAHLVCWRGATQNYSSWSVVHLILQVFGSIPVGVAIRAAMKTARQFVRQNEGTVWFS